MEVTKPIKVGNVWTNLISGTTGESVNFEEVSEWYDGTPMDDSKVDGVIYRKLPVSAGGGYVKRVWSGAFKMKWAGVSGDGVTDNTPIYDKIIAALQPNSYIEWEPNGVYVGSFNSTKPFTLDFNYSTIVNTAAGTQPVIRFAGEVDATFGTVDSPTSYGDNFFQSGAASLLSPGDIVALSDETVRPFDSAPDINTELIMVKEVDGSTVYVYDMIRSDQSLGTIRLFKVDTIKDVRIQRANVVCQNLHSSQVIFLQGVENLIVEDVKIDESSLMAITQRYCYNVSINGVEVNNPDDIETGGRGYGVHNQHSRNINITNISGLGTRHLIDFNSCYTATIDGVNASGGNSDQVVIAHNTFGGNFSVKGVVQEGGIGVVSINSQGISGAANIIGHVFHDLVVQNIQHIISLDGWAANADKRIRTVVLESSLDNAYIDNIRTHLTGELSGFTLTSDDHSTVRVYGVPVGPTVIQNVSANKIGSLIRFLSFVLTPGNMPAHQDLFVSKISSDDCVTLLHAGGCSGIYIDGMGYYGTGAPSLITLTQLASTPHTTKLSVRGLHRGTSSLVTYPVAYNGFLVEGGVEHVPQVLSLEPTSATTLSQTDLTLYKRVVINNTTGGNLVLNAAFLPQPVFNGQEVVLAVEATSGNVINLSGAAQNISYGRQATIRLRAGNEYRLRARLQGGVKVWVMDSVTPIVNDGLTFNQGDNSLSGIPSTTGGTITHAPAPNGVAYVFNGTGGSSSFGLTYNSASDRFRLLTFLPSNQLNYQADIVTTETPATTTALGATLQAEASADTAAPSVAEPTKLEFDALLAELRDLKTKMRAAGLLAT